MKSNAQSPLHIVSGQLDTRKAQMLKRMGDKLAGRSQRVIEAEQKFIENKRQATWSWGWRGLSLSIIVALSATLFVFREKLVLPSRVKNKVAILKPLSQSISLDEQLLYWTYALYDIDKLRTQFKTSPRIVIDGRLAKSELSRLMPKAGAKARFITERYIYNNGRPQ